jgi:hypothetical protein
VRVAVASPAVTALSSWTVAMLLEYWHTTYLEEGVCEGGGGQPSGDGAVALDFGELAYNIPVGRRV